MPIAEEFRPDLVIVSAGFDAMEGDELGRLSNSPDIYAYMTHQIMQIGQGKTVFALEGGYNLRNLKRASKAVLKTMLGDTRPSKGVNLDRLDEFDPQPSELGRAAVEKTHSLAREYWSMNELK